MDLKLDTDYSRQSQGANSHIDLALIESINSETNTMDVILPYIDNQKINDIRINQMVSTTGYGIKFMPIPGTTYAFIHKASNTPDRYIHVGYFTPDNETITDNSLGTKKGDIIFQRYLESGEVQLISKGKAELFLDGRGNVLISSGSGYLLSLSDYDGGLKGVFENADITTANTKVSLGRVKRRNLVNSSIDNVIRKTDTTPYSEHRIDIGIQYDEKGIPLASANTQFPDIKTNPSVGAVTFGEVVHDIFGVAEKMLPEETASVQWLINMASGIKVGIDTSGVFWLVNSATGSYLKYMPSQVKEGNVVVDKSSFQIKFAKANFSLSSFGEFLYTNEYVKDSDNSKVELSINKSGDFKAEVSPDGGTAKNTILMNKEELSITNDDGSTKNSVKLIADGIVVSSNSGDPEEKTLLGEKTKTLLSDLLTALISHTHGSPVGPTTPPTNAADFTKLQTTDLPLTLSKKTKNN